MGHHCINCLLPDFLPFFCNNAKGSRFISCFQLNDICCIYILVYLRVFILAALKNRSLEFLILLLLLFLIASCQHVTICVCLCMLEGRGYLEILSRKTCVILWDHKMVLVYFLYSDSLLI